MDNQGGKCTPMSSLNEAKIRAARPQKKQFKLFDERGLFMLVTPAGGRLWRLRYRLNGVEKLLALGAHPDVPLKRAREKREEARKLIADGIDPIAQRKAERAVTVETFEFVAREWLALQTKTLTADTFEKVKARLETFLLPYVGVKPIADVTAQNRVREMIRFPCWPAAI